MIAQPSNEVEDNWAEPAFTGEGWWPANPTIVHNVSPGRAFTDTVLTQLGQFNNQLGQQRLYDSMNLDVYYSTSPDWDGPEITYVGERADPARAAASVKVEAHDISGILRGKVTYTAGDGNWKSADLVYSPTAAKWVAEIPATSSTRYFVQMVDGAGNVTVADNKGRYYAVEGLGVKRYLPIVVGRR